MSTPRPGGDAGNVFDDGSGRSSQRTDQGPGPLSRPDRPGRGVQRKGLALAGLIVGVCALVLSWVPFFGVILALVALVLAIVALAMKQRLWMCITGTVLGAIALLVGSVVTIAFVVYLGSSNASPAAVGAADSGVSSEAPAEAPAEALAEESAEEPAEEPAEAPVAGPDPASFAATDERSFALLAKDPDSHAGENVIVFGSVTQLDAATGTCNMLVSAGAVQTEYSYDYPTNAWASAGDGDAQCPVFDALVEGDHVKLWVTVLGSYSYETQIGGNTTVPAFEVLQAELLPSQEY